MRGADRNASLPVARVALLTVTVLVVHVLLFSRFSLFAVRPEPFLLVAIVGALHLGPRGGALLGCAAGLGADLISASPIGLWLLVCGLIGLGLGSIRDQLSPDRQRATLVVSVLSGTVLGLVFYPSLAFAVTEQPFPTPLRFVSILVFATLWNILLTPLFLVAVRRLFVPKEVAR